MSSKCVFCLKQRSKTAGGGQDLLPGSRSMKCRQDSRLPVSVSVRERPMRHSLVRGASAAQDSIPPAVHTYSGRPVLHKNLVLESWCWEQRSERGCAVLRGQW